VQQEGEAAGEHLKADPLGTNIFAENWEGPLYSSSENPNVSPIQWIVKSAFTLTPGPLDQPPYPWASSQVYTLDACKTSYPPALAIGGSLINGGTAYFNAWNIPPYCQ